MIGPPDAFAGMRRPGLQEGGIPWESSQGATRAGSARTGMGWRGHESQLRWTRPDGWEPPWMGYPYSAVMAAEVLDGETVIAAVLIGVE